MVRSGCEHAVTRLVERQAVDRDAFFRACRRTAPEHRLDPRDQFARGERLGEVIVGPALESRDLVGLLGARRQHDDGDVAGIRVTAKLPCQFEPAHVGQHPVHQHQVRAAVADAGERGLAVLGGHDLKAGAPQPECNQVADRRLVLDDQNPGFGHT